MEVYSPMPGKPMLDDSSGLVRLVRELPPQHCILKVDSFSKIKDAVSGGRKDYIESTEFTAVGYKWVLHVYPSGNKKENGDGHLSFYVAMVDELSCGIFVNVALRFFIYDQLHDNYLTIVDLREKRFQAVKRVWGIPKVLPVSSFTDDSNGFLVNDCCVFGAEVLVINGEAKTCSLSIIEENCDRRYTWKIEEFSNMEAPLHSPIFTIEGWSWKLVVYPRGCGVENGKSISVFLALDNDNDLQCGSKLFVKYRLCLKNQLGGADQRENAYAGFCPTLLSWGYRDFLPLSDLNSPKKGFKVDDIVVIEVDIKVMFMLEAMGDQMSVEEQ